MHDKQKKNNRYDRGKHNKESDFIFYTAAHVKYNSADV